MVSSIKDPRIKESPIVTSSGCFPARIVLIQHPSQPADRQFSTHIEVLPTDDPAYLVSGDYDLSLSQAEHSYEQRVKRLGEW